MRPMDAIEAAEQPEIRGVRIDLELKEELEAIARKHDRSLAAEVRRALKMYVADYREIDRG